MSEFFRSSQINRLGLHLQIKNELLFGLRLFEIIGYSNKVNLTFPFLLAHYIEHLLVFLHDEGYGKQDEGLEGKIVNGEDYNKIDHHWS